MNTRIMAVALVVGILFTAGASQAQAQEVQLVRVHTLGVQDSGSWVSTPRIIVVIGQPNEATTVFPPQCGLTLAIFFEDFEVVVVRPNRPALRLTMYRFSGDSPLAPGTRLSSFFNDSRSCCLDENAANIACSAPALHEVRKFTANVIQPSSAGSALFSSPVELDSDSIGVVTGEPNDDGTHTVIFKKQGSPAQQVNISSDDVLLAADVLRGLIDLGEDSDGKHLYLAEIEW